MKPGLFAVVLLVAGVSQAQAQPRRRAAVLRLEFGERVPEVGRARLSSELLEALAANEFQPFAGPVVNNILKKDAALESCREDGCYRRAAGRLGVDFLVVGAVRAERRSFEVDLALVSGRSGRVLNSKTSKCELCGIAEVGEKLSKLVGALASGAAPDTPPTARVSIDSLPSGATVSIDGRPRGPTPLDLELEAGEHKVAVASHGYLTAEKRLRTEEGTKESVSIVLARSGGPVAVTGNDPVRDGGGLDLGKWGWRGVFLGAAAIVGGTVFLLLDGKRVGSDEDGSNIVNEFKLQAGLLLGGGAVLTGTSAVMIFVSPSTGGATRADAASTATAWTGGFRGRF